jgi:hypothetical protein
VLNSEQHKWSQQHAAERCNEQTLKDDPPGRALLLKSWTDPVEQAEKDQSGNAK